MQGWVTLTNNTGTAFHAANTLLVAGNPAGGGNEYNPRRNRMVSPAMVPGTESAGRERLGDFYLYPIAQRTTIANNQTKQVSFLDVQGVPAGKVYGRTVEWLAVDGQPVPVESRIGFSSSKQGGLGDALPAGTVRFYQRDAQGNPQFIGENGIGHTPMGSQLTLSTGDAFDIFAQAEVESRSKIASDEYERSARYRVTVPGQPPREVQVDRAIDYYRTTMRYTLTNAKPQAVEVELVQGGLDRGWAASDYRVVREDVPGEQLNLDSRRYRVTVPANGKREVRVTYETRY
jgi:hypothetical protein